MGAVSSHDLEPIGALLDDVAKSEVMPRFLEKQLRAESGEISVLAVACRNYVSHIGRIN